MSSTEFGSAVDLIVDFLESADPNAEVIARSLSESFDAFAAKLREVEIEENSIVISYSDDCDDFKDDVLEYWDKVTQAFKQFASHLKKRLRKVADGKVTQRDPWVLSTGSIEYIVDMNVSRSMMLGSFDVQICIRKEVFSTDQDPQKMADLEKITPALASDLFPEPEAKKRLTAYLKSASYDELNPAQQLGAAFWLSGETKRREAVQTYLEALPAPVFSEPPGTRIKFLDIVAERESRLGYKTILRTAYQDVLSLCQLMAEKPDDYPKVAIDIVLWLEFADADARGRLGLLAAKIWRSTPLPSKLLTLSLASHNEIAERAVDLVMSPVDTLPPILDFLCPFAPSGVSLHAARVLTRRFGSAVEIEGESLPAKLSDNTVDVIRLILRAMNDACAEEIPERLHSFLEYLKPWSLEQRPIFDDVTFDEDFTLRQGKTKFWRGMRIGPLVVSVTWSIGKKERVSFKLHANIAKAEKSFKSTMTRRQKDWKAKPEMYKLGFGMRATKLGLADAIWRGNRTAVRGILATGVDPNGKIEDPSGDFDDSTAFMLAVRSDDPEVVRILLAAGANPNEKYPCGRKVLETLNYSPVQHCFEPLLLRYLLAAGATTADCLDNPIHLAAAYGNREMLEELIKAGVNMTEPSRRPIENFEQGLTALQIAEARQHFGTIALLRNL